MNTETETEASATCIKCGEATHNSKPYCPDHILLLPYPQRVQLALWLRGLLGAE